MGPQLGRAKQYDSIILPRPSWSVLHESLPNHARIGPDRVGLLQQFNYQVGTLPGGPALQLLPALCLCEQGAQACAAPQGTVCQHHAQPVSEHPLATGMACSMQRPPQTGAACCPCALDSRRRHSSLHPSLAHATSCSLQRWSPQPLLASRAAATSSL